MTNTTRPARVYIAGPMTGHPDYNRPAFHAAAHAIHPLGYDVTNPAGLPGSTPEWDWSGYLRADLCAMLGCDIVTVLPGWECSPGATLEVRVAHAVRIPVYPLDTLLALRPGLDAPGAEGDD
jgi:hypothetical protein